MTTEMKMGWIYGVFAIATAGVLALVLWGSLTHSEPGFLDASKRWDHVPLQVSCAGYTAEEDSACEGAASAIATINSRLGFRMLTRADVPGADIKVTMRAPVTVGGWDAVGGQAELRDAEGVYTSCLLWVRNVSGEEDLEWLVTQHELGHCLGLADDDYSMSIMNATGSPTPDHTLPAWISDWDRGLLRERYAPEAKGH